MPWALIRLAMASTARLAVVPAQDLLGLGSESRMNTPGPDSGNWAWQADRRRVRRRARASGYDDWSRTAPGCRPDIRYQPSFVSDSGNSRILRNSGTTASPRSYASRQDRGVTWRARQHVPPRRGTSAKAEAPAPEDAVLEPTEFEGAARARRAPRRRWPPSRSWTGASSTTCTGRAADTPTSTTWWSAPEGSSSSTRRPGPGTSRWPTVCFGTTGTDASGTSSRPSTRAAAVGELVPGLDADDGQARALLRPGQAGVRLVAGGDGLLDGQRGHAADLTTHRPGRRDAPRHRRGSRPVAEGGHRPDRADPAEASRCRRRTGEPTPRSDTGT